MTRRGAVDHDGAAVREDPLRAGVAERDTHAHDGIRVIPADDLGDHIALLGAQPGAFGRRGTVGKAGHGRRARAGRLLADGLPLREDNGSYAFCVPVQILIEADSDLAMVWLERGLERAREEGDGFALCGDLMFSCLAHFRRGELADAVIDGMEALEAIGPRTGTCLAMDGGVGAVTATARFPHSRPHCSDPGAGRFSRPFPATPGLSARNRCAWSLEHA